MKNKKTPAEDISCEDAMKYIREYIDRQLNGRSVHSLEEHIKRCKHCYDRTEFEKLLKNRLRQLQINRDPADLQKRIEELLET